MLQYANPLVDRLLTPNHHVAVGLDQSVGTESSEILSRVLSASETGCYSACKLSWQMPDHVCFKTEFPSFVVIKLKVGVI